MFSEKMIFSVRTILAVIVAGVGITVSAVAAEPPIKLRGDRQGAIYAPGEPVVFKASALPAGLESLRGQIFDSEKKPVATVDVSGEELVKNGWRWTPSVQGFYEIEFSLRYRGKTEPVVYRESYSYGKQLPPFSVTRYAVAVIPPPPPMKDRAKMLGFVGAPADCRRGYYALAERMGFAFIRLHSIGWGAVFSDARQALEPERGRFNWEELDHCVAEADRYGFEIIGNIMYTPRWASPHPDRQKRVICVLQYSAFAPADMEDWRRFLRLLLARYGSRIKFWEIWNEVSFPGRSCFWEDTPEKFMAIQKSAWEEIKKLQPDGELWLAQMDPAYYEYLVKNYQLQNYYDKFQAHGRLSDPRPFHDIDRKYGVKPKPWVNLEDHGPLVRGMEKVSEEEVAARAITDCLFEMKHGAERIAMFDMVNLSEIDELPHWHKIGRITQASGFFRRQPRLEPRFSAVAFADFSRRLHPNPRYVGEYEFSGGQQAVLLNNGRFPVLIFWSKAKTPVAMDQKLVAAAGSGSTVSDWEGHPFAAGPKSLLTPGRIYYIERPDLKALGTTPVSRNVLTGSYDIVAKDLDTPVAEFPARPLFDAAGKLVDPKPVWIDSNWKCKDLYRSSHSPGLSSARFAAGFSKDNFELAVEVKDAAFGKSLPAVKPGQQNFDELKGWNYDSVQFAVDTGDKGLHADIMEFVMLSTTAGPVIYKSMSPYLSGADLPPGWTPQWLRIADASVAVERTNDGALYKLRINWKELFPYTASQSRPMRFSLLVNNNDGEGRNRWLEWSGGIGDSKDAALYGKLFFIPPDAKVTIPLSSRWNIWSSGKASKVKLEAFDRKDGQSFSLSGKRPESGLSVTDIQVYRDIDLRPNTTYLLSFRASASAPGVLEYAYLKSSPPWKRYLVGTVNIAKEEKDYLLLLTTGILPAEQGKCSLRFFLGRLAGNEFKFANLQLREISALK